MTLFVGKFRKITVDTFYRFVSHDGIQSIQGVSETKQILTRARHLLQVCLSCAFQSPQYVLAGPIRRSTKIESLDRQFTFRVDNSCLIFCNFTNNLMILFYVYSLYRGCGCGDQSRSESTK
jgi:hypothetical protein